MSYWCVANTQPNAEDKAVFHLMRQGFNVLLPKHLKRRSHARKVDWVPRPLFPGYLFIEIDPAFSPWRAIRSTVGIFDVIRFGDRPAPVPAGVMDEIRARQDANGLIKTSEGQMFKAGEPVRILRGALGEFEALFEATCDRNRVTVLLSILGRQVRAQVNKEDVFAST
ncbi:transcriptional activator RfaH [Thalassospiraceae bacterium LMO-JJ14]|nr:transcriptional activator RfaH [Thalassospiraceae bacterium LMO-JJ14]